MPNKNRKAKRKSGFSLRNLTIGDWLIIGFFVILIFVPDPVDFLTVGLPLVESVIALIYTVSMTFYRGK